MKISHSLLMLALGVGSMQLASCSKEVDNSDPSLSLQQSNEVVITNSYGNCKLRRILTEDVIYEGRLANGLFTYYANGNPYSLTYPDGVGNADYLFYYDQKGRLKELYVDEFFIPIKHKYSYNNLDQAVTDTLFNATNINEQGQYIFTPRFISYFTYDNKGRIIKEESSENGVPGATRTYSYDARGNLIVPGYNYTYDNKVSIFRSHPVFQMIHRNYSVNNPVQAKYNSLGLPQTLRPSNDDFFDAYRTNPGGGFVGGIIRAIYDCD